jgi:hypothetical protein
MTTMMMTRTRMMTTHDHFSSNLFLMPFLLLLVFPSFLLKVDNVLDLYYRHEYRGSQGRLTLMYRNLAAESMTNFDAVLVKGDDDR